MPNTFVPISISDAATYTVLAKNRGLTHYVPDVTASITITLPSPKAGMWYEFVYAGGAADAQDMIITTASDTNYFVGGVGWMDLNGDTVNGVYSNGSSNSKITVVTPAAGTILKVQSYNGTTWLISGNVISDTTPAFANQ